jgi:hypothetical protein
MQAPSVTSTNAFKLKIDLTDEQFFEILYSPSSLSGEDVLPGFVLDLAKVM